MPTRPDKRIRRVRTPTVRTTITVEAPVVEGEVSPAELAEWVSQALSHYHTFRAGFVDTARPCMSGIRQPQVLVTEQ